MRSSGIHLKAVGFSQCTSEVLVFQFHFYLAWERSIRHIPNSKFHGANMGPTWVLSAPDGSHVGPMNLAVRDNLVAIFVAAILVPMPVMQSSLCNSLQDWVPYMKPMCLRSSHKIQWLGFMIGHKDTLTARFVGPTWGPSGANRTQMPPTCWPHEICYLGSYPHNGISYWFHSYEVSFLSDQPSLIGNVQNTCYSRVLENYLL